MDDNKPRRKKKNNDARIKSLPKADKNPGATVLMLPLKVTGEYSLNASGHWATEYGNKKMIEGLVTVSAKQLERKITYRVPVVIELLYNSGLDIDNHGLLAKAIIDGLRYANILEDDNKRCVVGLFQRFTSNPGVTIIISPAKDKHVNIEDIIEMTG